MKLKLKPQYVCYPILQKVKYPFFSPTLFAYAIVSAVHIAVRRNRISENEGIEIIKDILDIGIALVNFSGLEEHTFRLANAYNRSVYDCAYIVLAQKEDCNFYTGDKRLFNSIRNKISFVKWLGDYRAPQ